MHIRLRVSKMVKDGENITIGMNYDVAIGLSIVFKFDPGQF